jgi:predicted ester cyclase
VAGGLLPWDPPSSSLYEARVRTNIASFHKNFVLGDRGKQANGTLVSSSIDWANNNANTLGRANFVSTLLSFNAPFPDLRILDVNILVDGNTGAVFYYFQGHQSGPFAGIEPAGRPLEIINTEIFTFDADALNARLITVNSLGMLEAQISGVVPAPAFGNFSLVENPQTTGYYRQKIKGIAAGFDDAFNSRNESALNSNCTSWAWVRPDVNVTTASGTTSTGLAALQRLFAQFDGSHPDLLAHDAYVIVDGQYVAVGSVLEGTFTGTFAMINGTAVKGDGKMYRTWAARWYQFDDEGFVVKVWDN